MKKNALFISSGIIDFKAEEVRNAIETAGLKVIEENHQGEWVNITAIKE
nr:50S ribosomal protein L11 methyltransferase [Lachnospiraceae bacterium]